MKPLKQAKLIFINTCGCIVDYELLEKAMLWYSNNNLMKKRYIYMHGRYPAVSIYDEKIHVHRLIGLYIYSNNIVNGIIVHHKNGNKLDCTVDNLELMSSKMHAYHHNKNKKLSEEHKTKIAEANKKRKGIKIKRRYNIPIEELKNLLLNGYSINKIAKKYGCDWTTIKSRINENPELLK